MASSAFSGPIINYGYKADTSGIGIGDGSSVAAPILSFQGTAIIDPRTAYASGTGPVARGGVGALPAFADLAAFISVDAIPWAAAAVAIVAPATATGGTKMALVPASGNGLYVNVPMVPVGQSVTAANVVRVLMGGPGTSSCTTAAGSNQVTLVQNRQIVAGMWLCIPDGIAAGTPWIAQVLSVAQSASVDGQATLTMSSNAGATVANGTIFPMDTNGNAVMPNIASGASLMFDPSSGVARGVSVTSNNAADTGWTVTVRGYDLWNVALTETIPVVANSTAYGKKAFKSIASVTPTNAGSTAGTFSVGTSDVFGLNFRSDAWEYAQIAFGGATNTANTGYLPAVPTLPATATTGDVRGTQQMGAVGGGTGFGGNSANGTAANIANGTGRRLTVFLNIPTRAMLSSNYSVVSPLFGVPQFGA